MENENRPENQLIGPHECCLLSFDKNAKAAHCKRMVFSTSDNGTFIHF